MKIWKLYTLLAALIYTTGCWARGKFLFPSFLFASSFLPHHRPTPVSLSSGYTILLQ